MPAIATPQVRSALRTLLTEPQTRRGISYVLNATAHDSDGTGA